MSEGVTGGLDQVPFTELPMLGGDFMRGYAFERFRDRVAAFGSLVPTISSRVLVLLVLGGCLYTVGVIFHLWEKLRYHNAIWHAFVLAGSICHFAAIIDALGLIEVL